MSPRGHPQIGKLFPMVGTDSQKSAWLTHQGDYSSLNVCCRVSAWGGPCSLEGEISFNFTVLKKCILKQCKFELTSTLLWCMHAFLSRERKELCCQANRNRVRQLLTSREFEIVAPGRRCWINDEQILQVVVLFVKNDSVSCQTP